MALSPEGDDNPLTVRRSSSFLAAPMLSLLLLDRQEPSFGGFGGFNPPSGGFGVTVVAMRRSCDEMEKARPRAS